jgi:hypothetical protein
MSWWRSLRAYLELIQVEHAKLEAVGMLASHTQPGNGRSGLHGGKAMVHTVEEESDPAVSPC